MSKETKKTKEPEIRYFAYLMCPGLGGIVSFITEKSYKLWLVKNCVIILHKPRSLKIVPDMSNPTVSIMYITPPVPIKTSQDTIASRADAIEILAEVEQDEDGNAFCKEGKNVTTYIRHLFSDYLKSLEQWTISLSDMAIPGAGGGVALAGDSNMIPLQPNKFPPR